MAEEWKNTVIETGVDTLLNYLAENQKASVTEISKDLGISKARIKEWADALEDSNFVKKDYSARKGMVLEYTLQNKEEIDQKVQELRKEVEKETSNIQKEMENRGSEIEQAQQKLKKMGEQLDEDREEEEEIKQQLEELEEMEDRIESRLEELEKEKSKVHESAVNLISRIDSALQRIEDADEKAERFEEKKNEIRKKVKALRKLEEHAEKADELEEELQDLEEEHEEMDSIFNAFMKKISGILSDDIDKSYEKILSGTVKESKQAISNLDNPDYGRLIDIEKEGKNRKTLIEWLERRRDE